MGWNLLILAGLFEIVWVMAMKFSEGFTRLWPTVILLVTSTISFVMLGLALKTIPVSSGYAVWTGIGAVGTAIIGMAVLGEPRTAIRIGCIVLITAGVIGLKLTAGTAASH